MCGGLDESIIQRYIFIGRGEITKVDYENLFLRNNFIPGLNPSRIFLYIIVINKLWWE